MGFLKFIQFTIPEYIKPYGLFHITFLLLVAAFTIILCVFYKNIKEKQLNKFLITVWLILVVLEIYKQFVFSYYFDDYGVIHWDYGWFTFPYQFCSTPLIFIPFIALNKGSNRFSSFIKEGSIIFCCTFSLFAGLGVMIAPKDVFLTYNFVICVQTMIHHGMQVALGVFLYVYYYKKIKYWSFLKALPIFIFFVFNALILNYFVPLFNGGEPFNMFFISPYYECPLPLLSIIHDSAPYLVFLLVYIVGFTALSFGIYNALYYLALLVKNHALKFIDNSDDAVLSK